MERFYLILLENQIVLQHLKECCKALSKIIRTSIFILEYIVLILLLEGVSPVWCMSIFGDSGKINGNSSLKLRFVFHSFEHYAPFPEKHVKQKRNNFI